MEMFQEPNLQCRLVSVLYTLSIVCVVQRHAEPVNSAAMVDNLLDGEQSALSKTIN